MENIDNLDECITDENAFEKLVEISIALENLGQNATQLSKDFNKILSYLDEKLLEELTCDK
jgi:hypothetical protein